MAATIRNPHAVLGLSESATEREVRAAYHAGAELFHPDRHAEAKPAVREAAEWRMKELNAAYREALRIARDRAAGRDPRFPRDEGNQWMSSCPNFHV